MSALLMTLVAGLAAVQEPAGVQAFEPQGFVTSVTVEIAAAHRRQTSTQACRECSAEGHDTDAKHCKYCGEQL